MTNLSSSRSTVISPWTNNNEAPIDIKAYAMAIREARRAHVAKAQRDRTIVEASVADPLIWLQQHTRTKDNHWREAGKDSPYQPFPDKGYFAPILAAFESEPVTFVEKSRDMMLSWACVGYLTLEAMKVPGREVIFQSQKEDKAAELVEYAKVLWDQQSKELKAAFPLNKPLSAQPYLELNFAHDSRIIGIPGGADQIRSYHPWGFLLDEAAFQPEAGESFDNAVSVAQKIIVNSSAGPGWMADFVRDIQHIDI